MTRASSCTTWLIVLLAAACGGDAAGPGPVPGDRLDGAPGSPAVSAVQRELYEPRAEDFSLGHPELPGVRLSHRVAILAITNAATVGEVNDLLDELNAEIAGGIPGAAGSAAALLAVRLPDGGHDAMEAALGVVRGRPFIVSATQDMEIGTTEVTDQNGGVPGAWLWDTAGAHDTWGLVAIRAPQLWNLNAAIRAAGRPPVLTGVLDAGFAAGHEDLSIFQYLGVNVADTHGTHVAGTIAASYNNQKGIDGVSPFSAVVGRVYGNSIATYAGAMWGLDDLIVGQPGVRVVNLSLGYNWYQSTPIVDARTDAGAQAKANLHGAHVTMALAALQAGGYQLPYIFAAAGNDSRALPTVDARFGSPYANAALALGTAAITVVESDARLIAGGAATYSRSVFSNVNGHLSAPGSDIWSSVPGGYASLSGTSMATPHVTGLASYLLALAPDLPAPTLTTNPVRDLLVANVHPAVRNGRPQIDAFASALAIDALRGNDAVLRGLVDVDDGTLDGNLRLDAAGAVVASENRTADNGRVDIADFRRWRDWLLQVENAGATLDGAPTHPKKDPNGDGVAGGAPAYEALYARGDFNGDGKLDRAGSRSMAGMLAGQTLTDLQVLQHLFNDPDYARDELPGLIESGDIHVDGGACLTLPNASTVVSTVTAIPQANPARAPRTHTSQSPGTVYTLAPASYRLRAEARNASGTSIGNAERDVTLAVGGDFHWRPTNCEALRWTFTSDREGWSAGGEGTVFHLGRDGGVLKLHATDTDVGVADTWIFRQIALPASARTLAFRVSAHDRDGATVGWRVRLVDAGGTSHTLHGWEILTGQEGTLTFVDRTMSIQAFAGTTVTVYVEQDDDGQHNHEHFYVGEIEVRD